MKNAYDKQYGSGSFLLGYANEEWLPFIKAYTDAISDNPIIKMRYKYFSNKLDNEEKKISKKDYLNPEQLEWHENKITQADEKKRKQILDSIAQERKQNEDFWNNI